MTELASQWRRPEDVELEGSPGPDQTLRWRASDYVLVTDQDEMLDRFVFLGRKSPGRARPTEVRDFAATWGVWELCSCRRVHPPLDIPMEWSNARPSQARLIVRQPEHGALEHDIVRTQGHVTTMVESAVRLNALRSIARLLAREAPLDRLGPLWGTFTSQPPLTFSRQEHRDAVAEVLDEWADHFHLTRTVYWHENHPVRGVRVGGLGAGLVQRLIEELTSGVVARECIRCQSTFVPQRLRKAGYTDTYCKPCREAIRKGRSRHRMAQRRSAGS